jgi:anti-sigma factor RsiW
VYELMTSDCRLIAERLASYVDGLLAPGDQADVEGHLAACQPCRSAALHERAARTVLRDRAATLRHEPLPPGLRSRCEALAREHARPPARAWATRAALALRASTPRLVPVSLTAILIVFTGTALLSLATQRSNTVLAAQLTADHAKCFKLFGGEGSATADAVRLEQMLADRYGWDVHVPPSSASAGVELVGARRCLYADGRIPHVMYRVNGRNVSLYMLEGVERRDADVTSFGHRSRIWSRGATTYVLVWPVGGGDMTTAARYVMEEAH